MRRLGQCKRPCFSTSGSGEDSISVDEGRDSSRSLEDEDISREKPAHRQWKPIKGYQGGRHPETGRPHGRGVMEYKNGDVYKGDWRDGKRHEGELLC